MGVKALIILSGTRLQVTIISVFFISLVNIPDEIFRLCQMGNDDKELRESLLPR